MTHRPKPSLLRPLRLPLIAGATCSLLLLSGCGGDEDTHEAVKQANRTFSTIALGDANAFQDNTEQLYAQMEQTLSEHAGDSSGFAEAAAVSLAMAKRGQAALASQEATRAETKAVHQARLIRGMINEYITNMAIARGSSAFDPSDDIAELNRIIELRESDIADYRRKMNQINGEIADHEANIARLRAMADEQREQAGELELQIPRVDAREGAELAKQMREFALRADQYDLEANRIEGILGQLRPGAREISLNVDKADSQIRLLKEAIEELRQRAADSRLNAQEAEANANAALKRINDAVQTYQAIRDGEIEEANNKAVSLVRASLSALRDARDAVKTVASLNKSDAQQLLAELLMRQAHGEREEAELYITLQQAGVPGDWQSRIDQANQRAEELLEEARQSYQASAAALRSVRAKGDAGEKAEAAAVRLDKLGGIVPEDEFDDGINESDDDGEAEAVEEETDDTEG